VKIISHISETVKEGIVGFQRQILATAINMEEDFDVKIAFSEAPMASVPNRQYAIDELERFREKCPG
jgi:hypothetical protein